MLSACAQTRVSLRYVSKQTKIYNDISGNDAAAALDSCVMKSLSDDDERRHSARAMSIIACKTNENEAKHLQFLFVLQPFTKAQTTLLLSGLRRYETR